MERLLNKSSLILSLLFAITNSASAATINANFDGGLPFDATLYGSASIINGEVELTPSLNSQLGGLSFSDQDNGASISSWSSEFDFRIDQNGNGGADGISLTYSRLGNVGAVGEEGILSGIAIGFDTWNNGEVSANHVSLRFDGVLLVQQHISSFLLQDAALHTAVMTMNNGLVELLIDNSSIFTHDIIGWNAYAGQFNFGGRTGGARSRQVIDNFSATTTSTSVPEPGVWALMSLGLVGFGFSYKRKSA